MGNSIQFSMGLDNRQYLGALKQSQRETDNVSKKMQEAFGTKLKQLLTFTAVEEGVRRTAEWAAELNRASKALGVTAEQLQTLQHIGSKTGTGESAMISLFENIQKSRDEALKGNMDLINSFQKLGVSMGDLAKLDTGKLFSKVMTGIPENIGNSNDQYMRTAANMVTGTPENVLATAKYGMGGKTLDENTAGLSGDIASEETVQQLATVWSEIITSLKEAGVQLAPLAGFILVFVKILVEALGGVAEVVGGLFNFIKGVLTADTETIKSAVKSIGGIFLNMMFGVGKLVFDLLTAAANLVGGWVSKIPGMGKAGAGIKSFAAAAASSYQEGVGQWNEMLGIGAGTQKRGGAVGETLGLVGTMGSSTLNKGAAAMANKAGAMAESFGMEKMATKLKDIGSKLDLKELIPGTPETSKRLAGHYGTAQKEIMGEQGLTLGDKGQFFKGEKPLSSAEGAAIDDLVAERALSRADKDTKLQKLYNAGRGIGAGAAAGAAGLVGLSEYDKLKNAGLTPKPGKPILPMGGSLFDVPNDSGGGSMLKFGGVFGISQMKVIKLNEQMVNLLTMIQRNTQPQMWQATGRVGAAPGM